MTLQAFLVGRFVLRAYIVCTVMVLAKQVSKILTILWDAATTTLLTSTRERLTWMIKSDMNLIDIASNTNPSFARYMSYVFLICSER